MVPRVSASLLAAILMMPIVGCGGPPQIGADKEAFKTVDALYTAVGLRDVAKLEDCGSRLRGLKESGKLPEDAWKTLEAIINQAKGGAWEPAQESLSNFMEGQRR
jgi:hypothetical protein